MGEAKNSCVDKVVDEVVFGAILGVHPSLSDNRADTGILIYLGIYVFPLNFTSIFGRIGVSIPACQLVICGAGDRDSSPLQRDFFFFFTEI